MPYFSRRPNKWRHTHTPFLLWRLPVKQWMLCCFFLSGVVLQKLDMDNSYEHQAKGGSPNHFRYGMGQYVTVRVGSSNNEDMLCKCIYTDDIYIYPNSPLDIGYTLGLTPGHWTLQSITAV